MEKYTSKFKGQQIDALLEKAEAMGANFAAKNGDGHVPFIGSVLTAEESVETRSLKVDETAEVKNLDVYGTIDTNGQCIETNGGDVILAGGDISEASGIEGDNIKAANSLTLGGKDVAVREEVPADVSRSQVDVSFVGANKSTALFYLRQATAQMAGVMTAADKSRLDALPLVQIDGFITEVETIQTTTPLDAVKRAYWYEPEGCFVFETNSLTSGRYYRARNWENYGTAADSGPYVIPKEGMLYSYGGNVYVYDGRQLRTPASGFFSRNEADALVSAWNAAVVDVGSFPSAATLNAALADEAKGGPCIMIGSVLNAAGQMAYGTVCLSVPFATGSNGGYFQGCLTSAGNMQGFATRTVTKNADGTRNSTAWTRIG